MRFPTEHKILSSAIHLQGVGGSQPTVSKLEVNLEGGESNREEEPTAASKLPPKAVPLTMFERGWVSLEGSLRDAPRITLLRRRAICRAR